MFTKSVLPSRENVDPANSPLVKFGGCSLRSQPSAVWVRMRTVIVGSTALADVIAVFAK